MEDQIPSDEDVAFVHRVDEEMKAMVGKSVTPIYGQQDGVAKQCGTGTLIKVAEMSFLITAEHVAKFAYEHGFQLFIADYAKETELIPLEGKLTYEIEVDIAIWNLGATIVERLPNRRFLTVHHGDKNNQRNPKGWYFIYGYPNCWSEADPVTRTTIVKPFVYGTTLYEGETNSIGKYDPDVHLLLEVPKFGNSDANCVEAEMPKLLQGISGCCLWQASYEGLPKSSWKTDDAAIMAVQTGTYKNHTIVKGTRWWIVERILKKAYPELSAPLSIATPHSRIVQTKASEN